MHTHTSHDYDVIVIGGGPAGMMASVSAARRGARVILLEKGNVLGRKLMISGGGRCNVTNAKELDELIQNIPGNGRFLFSVFHQFNNRDIMQYFENLGIKLKEEDRGRMFPVTDKAKTVRDAMVKDLKRLGVDIRLNAPVKRLHYQNGRFHSVELNTGDTLHAGAVVVAVGGRSVPESGSTGDGYIWAREAGHTIIEPFPSAVGLTAGDTWVKERTLQGLSLKNVVQTLYDPRGKKKITTEEGDMIFTHFGISGPVTFRTSRYVTPAMKKYKVNTLPLSINLQPQESMDNWMQSIRSRMKSQPDKSIKNILKGTLPERMIPLLLQLSDINPDTNYHHLPKSGLAELARLIFAFPVTITGTLPLEKATVTAGGVHVKEIEPGTLQSRLVHGLFFAGEVMDVDAHTGGYNITVAFCTGYVAGASAASESKGFEAVQNMES